MGDKTQLLSFLLASRFPGKQWSIIAGIFVATIFNHLFAAALGDWAASHVSPDVTRWVLGIAFLGFAAWALIPDKLDDEGNNGKRAGAFDEVVPGQLFQGHTRFATSSITSLDGCHPHQWSPRRVLSVYSGFATGAIAAAELEALIEEEGTLDKDSRLSFTLKTEDSDRDFAYVVTAVVTGPDGRAAAGSKPSASSVAVVAVAILAEVVLLGMVRGNIGVD